MSKKVFGRLMSGQLDNHKLAFATLAAFAWATGSIKYIISLRKFIIAAVSFLFIMIGSFYVYIEEQGNFHSITSGEAYRSAQMDRDELEYYIKKCNIKSIINLRGRNLDEPWYREEIKVSAERNIAHYDLPLSSTREPSEEDVRKLIEIFKHAPRPVLIHCQAGADRSGLAAAMWKVVVDKKPKLEAKKQLSILYGHIPIGETMAMDSFFQKWNPE